MKTIPLIDQDLIQLFKQCFFKDFNTLLEGNTDEPLYTPATDGLPSRIFYAHDYFASALHEVAHWCIAGEKRRQLEDYGYWYEPDGRSTQQQQLFESVEIAPQAMEWIFSRACHAPFRISADNLTSNAGCSEHFKDAVYQQAQEYLKEGLPKRAEHFVQKLAEFYRNGDMPRSGEFVREEL